MKPIRDPEWLTTERAAEHLCCSVKAFQSWAARHPVPFARRGKVKLYDKHALDEFVRREGEQHNLRRVS